MNVNLSESLLSFTPSLTVSVPLYWSMTDIYVSEIRQFFTSQFEWEIKLQLVEFQTVFILKGQYSKNVCGIICSLFPVLYTSLKNILTNFVFRTGAWGMQWKYRQCWRGQGLWQRADLFPCVTLERQDLVAGGNRALGTGLLDKKQRRVNSAGRFGVSSGSWLVVPKGSWGRSSSLCKMLVSIKSQKENGRLENKRLRMQE